jgi:WhiB family transcriptional regulator, redox-sensing transcriptional regulator
VTLPDSWRERALCPQVDPELFFPPQGCPAAAKRAKNICAHCEVRRECLNDALANNEAFGIWGGLSERERRRLKYHRPAS